MVRVIRTDEDGRRPHPPVEQRITMDARKAKMEEEMMKHMMQHMQMGKESMSQCPMMKGMKGMDEKSADAHKEHQEEQK